MSSSSLGSCSRCSNSFETYRITKLIAVERQTQQKNPHCSPPQWFVFQWQGLERGSKQPCASYGNFFSSVSQKREAAGHGLSLPIILPAIRHGWSCMRRIHWAESGPTEATCPPVWDRYWGETVWTHAEGALMLLWESHQIKPTEFVKRSYYGVS